MLDTHSDPAALNEIPGLVRALRVLRERWWVILACAVVSGAAATVYVEHQTKLYTATSALQFTTNSLPSQVAGVVSGESLDPEGEKNTNLQLVTTIPVARLVIKALRLDVKPSALLEEVKASNPQDDYIVDISVTNKDPVQATEIANAFAQQYIIYSQQQNEEQLVKGQELINQKYAQLPANDTTDRNNLRNLSQKLLLLQAVQAGNARVANVANTPTTPSSPKKAATVTVAIVFGLVLGIGLAFLLNLLDRRAKSWEELEELYGISPLVGIPPIPRRLRGYANRETALEPFRILNNSLATISPSGDVRVVLVTSAVPGEGKTTVALGLARAAALSGRKVILVEADFRRPTLQQQIGRGSSVATTNQSSALGSDRRGLSSVLRSGGDPLELLRSPIHDLDNLKVLFAGPTQIHGLNVNSARNLPQVVDALASHADLVVIDSAPLLPVADTRIILDEAPIDVCLIVARAGVATRDEARRTRSMFDRRRLQSIGLVINSISEVANDNYYGYGIVAETSEEDEDPQVPFVPGDSGLGRPVWIRRVPSRNNALKATQNEVRVDPHLNGATSSSQLTS